MRFATSALLGSVRAATSQNSARFGAQGWRSVRNYASEAGSKKNGGNGLVLAALAGAGAAGGIYYNQKETKVEPASAKEVEPAFDPSQFKAFKLEKVEPINHNTSLYRFSLPSENHVAGLPVASCVITRYPITKKDGSPGFIIRPYTPTSSDDTKGYVDFIVKVYPDGKMSKHIHNLKVGETLDIKGPITKYNWSEKRVDNVGMIAGGTGITPMLQVIRKVFDKKSGDDKTKITLIFANQTEEDILLKEELDGYAKTYPDRFNVVYVLDRPPKDWSGAQGYVSADLIKKSIPGPDTESLQVFVCGPDPMLAAISGPKAKDKSQGEVGGVLKELGYTEKNVFKF